MTAPQPARRNQMNSDVGVELDADDNQFDVTKWRDEMIEIAQNSRAPYDEIPTVKYNTFVAGSAVYGFIPTNFRTFLDGNGTADINENVFEVTSGNSLGDFGVIRSFRSLNYKTGQGAVIRFSGRFENPQALTWSGIGGFNIGDELSFGYDGLDFGIWHRYAGLAEVQSLQITSGASGAETASVTIDGTLYSIQITAGTAQFNAYEIADYLKDNGVGFNVEQVDDEVRIDFISDGDKTGAFTFSSATATGAWTELTAGVLKTSTHIPIADWNGREVEGLDPTKGNAYQITYQNGFGDAHFYIEHPDTGRYTEVHTLKWANNNNITNLTNPSLRLGCYATSIGSAVPTKVQCAYVAGFVTGSVSATNNPRAFSNTKSIATAATNILTLRNSYTYNGRSNQVEIAPLGLTLANDGAKTAVFELRAESTVGGVTNFQESGVNIVAQTDISGTTVSTDGRLLGSFVVARGQSLEVDLTKFLIRIPPSLSLVISGVMTSGSASDLTASITWYEDV